MAGGGGGGEFKATAKGKRPFYITITIIKVIRFILVLVFFGGQKMIVPHVLGLPHKTRGKSRDSSRTFAMVGQPRLWFVCILRAPWLVCFLGLLDFPNLRLFTDDFWRLRK